MKVKSDITTKIDFKNAMFNVNEDGRLEIVEDLGDEGYVATDFLGAIEKFIGDKMFTLSIKNVSDNLPEEE